ncbi:MAG TPA: carbonic anhydrase [Pyrinomonadaceae bacterium]|jgi:carbonic anhydrase|nr:carbonic anhydrase [Pyrinomonadaceae bacterium]
MESKEARIELEEYVSEHLVSEIRDAAGVPLLLLQCMDSRYPHRTIQTMDNLGLRGKYDQLILAGASLGVVLKPEWTSTFFDHLDFAIREHHVSQVLILDHRDCGAYKKFLDPPVYPDDPAKEKAAHIEHANRAIGAIRARFPQLTAVRSLLLPIEAVEELVAWP